MVSPLSSVLEEHYPEVIDSFTEMYSINDAVAEDIFIETKKWLWLCGYNQSLQAKGEEGASLFIDDSLLIIDKMWHTFILYTKLYTIFCNKHFGSYIHHYPTPPLQKKQQADRFDKDVNYLEQFELRQRKQYEFVSSILGKETLIKWYFEYPETFSRKAISQLHLSSGQ